MTKSAGYTIAELSNIFDQMKPDVVVVLADRYENLPVAICASYMNIPLAHIQGGEITGSIDEKVRHAITKLSDIHFTSTERSKKFVIRMGENDKMVFNTGCPSIDLVKKIKDKLPLNKLSKFGVGSKLKKNDRYLVVMQHPVTTEIGSTTSQIKETIKAIKIVSKNFDLKVLWFWPNVDAGNDKISKILRKFRENENPDNLIFIKNLPPKLFIQVLKGCVCMIGNSSSGIREGSFIGVPYVNIGNRQDGREKCKNVISVRCNSTEIIKAVKKQISKGFYKSNNLYGKGNSSGKIAKLLLKLPLTYVKKINYI
jgi:UDP-hydrolysing UDP-N-acetyl-D-glucosamine 2-epimerase